MSIYWLAPITCWQPLIIGAERLHCEVQLFDAFRNKVQSYSDARFLLMFKSSLLLSDDEEVCAGGDETLIDFAALGEVVFDESSLRLSHCADAFLQRLPSHQEWQRLLRSVPFCEHVDWSPIEQQWLQFIIQWCERGYDIVLLKEA